mmetsp:Transcript_21041/g.58533  ORF Transcript_21041/g.58533 Transcript_21041/m.58533 type:complete len:125 (-) Transcript_21041:830-1204(-)
MSIPNPLNLLKGTPEELPQVEQIGTVGLEELNEYHCNNEKRRMLSLFGTIYDVTSSEKSYGKSGACELHATTLATRVCVGHVESGRNDRTRLAIDAKYREEDSFTIPQEFMGNSRGGVGSAQSS